jgi:hypothetical protein
MSPPDMEGKAPGIVRLLTGAVLGALIAVVIMLLFGILADVSLARQMNEQFPLLVRLGEVPLLQKWLEQLDLIDMPEIMMYFNLVHAKLAVSGLSDLVSGGMEMSLKWLSLLLFPLVSLTSGGYWAARWHGYSKTRGTFPVSLIIGGIYGLFLLTAASFAGFHRQVSTQVLFTSLKGAVDYSFSPGEAFLHGLLFGTLFSWLGQAFWGRRHRGLLAQGTFRPVPAALQATGWGWAAASVLMLVVWLAQAGEAETLRTGIQLMPQLGGYAWGVANLGELALVTRGGQTTASVWAGIASSPGSPDPLLSGAGYPVVARLVPVIALAVLLWSGKKLAGQPVTLRAKLVQAFQFSLVYALSLTFLAFVTKLDITFHGGALSRFEANGTAFSVGLGVLPVFFSSLALALGVLGACSVLFKGSRR